jgi:hypothetical protein
MRVLVSASALFFDHAAKDAATLGRLVGETLGLQ